MNNRFSINSVLCKIISKLKGELYSIDPQIPLTYIIRTILNKCLCLFLGMIRLRTFKLIMIDPSSTIKCSSKISFGKSLNIGPHCYIDALSREGLVFGDNVSMGYKTHLDLSGSLKHIATSAVIGNNVGLGTHGHYGCGVGRLVIGDYTIFGNYCSVHPETHNFNDLSIPIKYQGVYSKGGVIIGRNCWIGAKVTLLDGTQLGDNVIVAAGAVVNGKFPDNSIVGGIPAKIIKIR